MWRDSGINQEETEFAWCLLPFPEPFVFPNAVYNRKGINRTVILLVVVYGCET
jgi:hypothetical protein